MSQKPLTEMSKDEIASLTPERFRELSAAHNDQVQRDERDYQQRIDAARTLTAEQLEARQQELDRKQVSHGLHLDEQREASAVNDEEVRRYREQDLLPPRLRETLLERLEREAKERGETLAVELDHEPERTRDRAEFYGRTMEKTEDRW